MEPKVDIEVVVEVTEKARQADASGNVVDVAAAVAKLGETSSGGGGGALAVRAGMSIRPTGGTLKLEV